MEVTGWPVATVKGGRVAMRDGKVQAEPGTGGSCRAGRMTDQADRRPARRLRRVGVRLGFTAGIAEAA